jgi:hypothetical protein
MTDYRFHVPDRHPGERRSVVLHIGVGKTGTSAIQTWLARNAPRLAEQGVHYPTPPEGFGAAVEGAVTSGNAGPLAQLLIPYLRDGGWSEAAALDWLDAALLVDAGTVLFSSEFLPSAGEEVLRQLRDRIETHGRSVRVICALRDLGPLAFSDWSQRVKRSGAWKDWPEICGEFAVLTHKHLDTYAAVFGTGAVRALNYESLKRDIVGAFMKLVAPVAHFDTWVERVNRSLSERELALLRCVNGTVAALTADGGRRAALATRLSDHLLSAGNAPALGLSLTPAQVEQLEANNRAALDRFNSAYLPDDPIRVAALELVSGPLSSAVLSPREEAAARRFAERALAGVLELPSLATGLAGEPADRFLAHLLAESASP